MGKMRVGAGAFRGRRRSQGAKGAAIDRASPTDGWAAPVQRGMRAGLAMSDGPASARIQANVGSLLAALRLPAAIAQPVAYRARRRSSRKAWYLSTVACVAALCTVAAQAAGQGTLIYVPNADDNTASVIDSATNATVATIPIGDGAFPLSVAVSGDQSRVWIATEVGVFAINTATNSVTQWTTVEPGDEVPKSVAVTPDGRTLYVSYDSGVVPMDTHSAEIGATIQMDGRATSSSRPTARPPMSAAGPPASSPPSIWCRARPKPQSRSGVPSYAAFGLSISPDGKTVVASSVHNLDARAMSIPSTRRPVARRRSFLGTTPPRAARRCRRTAGPDMWRFSEIAPC